jgi:hypothetical protein
MVAISLDRTLVLSPDAIFRDLDGEGVILALDSGHYFGLNAVGSRIWHLVERHGRLDAVLEQLRLEYDAPPDVLERDLLALAGRLADAGLVVVK